MLKFAGAPYKVPDHVYVHGFIGVSGEKMSKSRGTGIDPLRYLELGMNPEWLRYYIAAKLNAAVEDVDFNPDDFVARVNSDLIGKYINIASRCAGFLSKVLRREAGCRRRVRHDARFATCRTARGAGHRRDCYDAREFGKALRDVMALADQANQFVDQVKPWDLAKKPAKRRSASACLLGLRSSMFRLLTIYLKPVMPALAKQVERFLNVPDLQWADAKRLAARRPCNWRVQAPHAARRRKAARRAVRHRIRAAGDRAAAARGKAAAARTPRSQP